MKRIRINTQKIGLVYRKGEFQRVITAGNHWLRYSEKAVIYNQLHIYESLIDMELVVQNELFKENIVQRKHCSN